MPLLKKKASSEEKSFKKEIKKVDPQKEKPAKSAKKVPVKSNFDTFYEGWKKQEFKGKHPVDIHGLNLQPQCELCSRKMKGAKAFFEELSK